jgi:CO/xanthine dehydrogenase FAD-binding subunit
LYSFKRMSVILAFSMDEALAALAAHPDALILAGGTDLLVEINEGHRRLGLVNDAGSGPATGSESPTVLAVDRLGELRSWTVDHERKVVHIGAGVTWSELMEEPLAGLLPALAEAARTVGSPQIRNAGTLGGNLGTCSPAGDGLPVLAALEAVVHLRSAQGSRDLPITDFMVGVKRTARLPGELITGVTLPIITGWQGYSKVGVRNAMVIATASAALVADNGQRQIRVALGSVGPTVFRCSQAEDMLSAAVDWDRGAVSSAQLREFGDLVAQASRPIDDHRSTAAYRRHSVGVMAQRLARRAFPVDSGPVR